MKEYAEILHAIADGKQIQQNNTPPGAQDFCWANVSPEALLLALGQGQRPTRLRVKPATININGHEVPEPLRVAPADGAAYWRVTVSDKQLAGAVNTWNDDVYDHRWLARGLCHATKEAAEQHARALLSFTTKE